MLLPYSACTQNDDPSPLLLAYPSIWYLICNFNLLLFEHDEMAAQGSCTFWAVIAMTMYGALAFNAHPKQPQAL